MKNSERVLEGIRVIEVGTVHTVPVAAAMLGDLGAEVIKVEQPEAGDPLRGVISSRGKSLILQGNRQALFEDFNRNKKGITLNLKQKKGREIIYRLVNKSDVFLTNLLSGRRQQFGLEYETLVQHNSRLVYGVGTGFGLKGPEADFPSFENTLYAKSGLMTSAGEPGQPTEIPPGIGDRIGAVSLAYAVLAALLHRERSGKGQLVTSSIFGGLVSHMTPLFMMGLLTGQEVTRMKSGKANPMFTTHRCKGDTWVNLHCFPEASLWPAFCKVLDVAYLENDPRFATVQERAKRWEELHSIVDPVFLTRTGEEWEKLFRQDKVPTSVVNQCSDVFSSPQALANQHIIEYDHPVLGRVKVVGFPMQLSETPLTMRLPAPELGQNTEEVLNEVCGYSAEEIEKLKDERVI